MTMTMSGRERRRHKRVSVPATLTLAKGSDYIGTYNIHDVSQGGARVLGRPRVREGDELDALLHLPGAEGIRLKAKVVHRVRPPEGTPAVGLCFLHKHAEDEKHLAQSIVDVLNQMALNQNRIALVADDIEDVRYVLKREIEVLGWNVVQASSFKEATSALTSLKDKIQLAFVDLYLGDDDPTALMNYLKMAHPKIRRVLMSGQASTGELHMLADAMPAHHVLPKPWDTRDLARIAMD